jgi:DNA/RNA-binding domain of Phe-tRNA-synthetase-like protein
MLNVSGTDAWRQAHPGACIGLLEVSGVENSRPTPGLEKVKRTVETSLRERYADVTRPDLLEIPVMNAYHRYYRSFGYTYHVLLQLESLVHKGKSLPDVSPLVDANFAAELDTLILTAGHDVARLQEPVLIDVAREGDVFTLMGGKEKAVPPGDMVMRDARGIVCSILRGQDNLSPITRETVHVLYVSYAPDGVTEENVRAHMQATEKYVRLFSPDCVVEQATILASQSR